MFDLGLDTFANLKSPIHQMNPRLKFIGFIVMIFSISFIQNLIVIPFILLISIIIFYLSNIPLSFLLRRLRYPGIFLIAMAIVLPFFSGTTTLFQLGPISIYQEGLLSFFLIAGKFTTILTLAIVLFGTAPILTTIKAMQELHLPSILADMLLMTYRYLFEIGNDFQKMKTSMQMKNFQTNKLNKKTMLTLASLSGTLLIRSYERAEKIYKAMILRGYANQTSKNNFNKHVQSTKKDQFYLFILLILSMGIIAFELFNRIR